MPIAKPTAPNSLYAMKSEEGNDSLDTIIRQVAKEPSISFSRAGDSPVPWIQLLHALDQQELPGWPLHSPIKVQMQKCDKCTREFCSSINYRRHIRVHHRLKKLDKDSSKNRELLGEFWDKLSPEEAKEAVSFKNVTLEEVPGSSIIKELTALIRKPGFSSMPHIYLKAGSALLDIVQARPSRFPISSHELFSILDDASEKTFLSGTAISMQRYIFDGDAGKIGLESKNLVACTSFLVEQKLVKAWHADKDAEALRLQQLLVEEEEAAQRRQAELLERKRQKKLRQKEQKAKDQRHGEKIDVNENIDDETLEAVPLIETSSPSATFDSDTSSSDVPDHVHSSHEVFQLSNTDENVDPESQTGFSSGHVDSASEPNVERRIVQGSGCRRAVVRWQVLPKSQRGVPNGFHGGQSSQTSKLSSIQNHGNHRDSRAASSGNRVWSRKPKQEYDGGSLKPGGQKDATEPDQIKNHEVLIGSIPVTLGNCGQESNNLTGVREDCLSEHQMSRDNPQDKANKHDLAQSGTNRSTVKLWRPVSRHGTKGGPMSIQNGSREFENDVVAEKGNSQNPSGENYPSLCVRDGHNDGNGNGTTHPDEAGSLGFSSRAAKDFLAQRWKEAIAAEHVELVLFQDSEPPPRCPDNQNESEVAATHWLKFKRSILGNRLVNVEAIESPTAGTAAKVKRRTKPEKGAKIKYIPKQSTGT